MSGIRTLIESVKAASDFKTPDTLTPSSKTLNDVVVLILKEMIYFAGVLAFVSLLIGGIQFITASGNSDQAAKGKKTIIYSAIGILIVVMSYSILILFTNVIKNYY